MGLYTKARLTDAADDLELENKELSLKAAREAIVLLENDGLLPMKPGKVALYGAGAGMTIKGGSGSGEVTERHATTIREGLEQRGFTILSNRWLDRYDALWHEGREQFIAQMKKKLRSLDVAMLAELIAADYRYPYGDAIAADDLPDDTDTCIYVLARQSGEGKDRRLEDFCISDAERGHLDAICARYANVILIVNTGASFDLSFVDDYPPIRSVVFACQLGQEGGYAVADVLTGTATPSGKLAATWAKTYDDIPFAREYSYLGSEQNHASYKEGIYVGYRYFDTFGVEPRYPFGFGLSYTDFSLAYGTPKVKGTEVSLDVTVTNTGSAHAGKQTVQLYVGCPDGLLDKEEKSLAAFAKTALLVSGESQVLTLRFRMEQLASYDQKKAAFILEQGCYRLFVGTSSRSVEQVGALMLPRTVTVSLHRNLCVALEPVQQLHHEPRAQTVPDDAIMVDPSAFRTRVMDYGSGEPAVGLEVEGLLERLGTKGQVDFCAGTGLLDGKTCFTLPGSVGNTTSAYAKMGIPNATFCDGPAGIRIQRRSTVDKKDKVKAVDGALSLYEYLPGWLQGFVYGNPAKETVLYQYVTSFPVEAAIAQTWNVGLAEEVGRAVSREMSAYGVVFWLAPALNIVRNPLCGRNYEYYSEDPLVSGKMAAAVVRGVQAMPGNYATIKHFAANNQEDNRYYVSSDMDERALREIYLRGFEIAVRESAPKAVMTAYNKINGVFCSANRELVTDILRHEWGFNGVVMTDWLSTGGDRAQNADVTAAGVDLIMPGGGGVLKDLRRALRSGMLSAETVRQSAGRVLSLIMTSQIEVR